MALLGEADWKKFLSSDSDMPPDVFFLVEGEDGRSSRIGAHRVLLGAISLVFRRKFFGPMKETKEETEVKDTSPEAFQAMINYIYAPRPEHQVQAAVSCPKILLQLFALADYYDILPLKTNILNHLWQFVVINRKKLIYTASIAFSYRELYADISTEMLKTCLKVYLELDETAKNSFPEASVQIVHQLMEFGKSTLQLSGNLKYVFGEN